MKQVCSLLGQLGRFALCLEPPGDGLPGDRFPALSTLMVKLRRSRLRFRNPSRISSLSDFSDVSDPLEEALRFRPDVSYPLLGLAGPADSCPWPLVAPATCRTFPE